MEGCIPARRAKLIREEREQTHDAQTEITRIAVNTSPWRILAMAAALLVRRGHSRSPLSRPARRPRPRPRTRKSPSRNCSSRASRSRSSARRRFPRTTRSRSARWTTWRRRSTTAHTRATDQQVEFILEYLALEGSGTDHAGSGPRDEQLPRGAPAGRQPSGPGGHRRGEERPGPRALHRRGARREGGGGLCARA